MSLVFVIFSITFLTFIVGYLAPGDPIQIMLGVRRDPAIYNNLRHQYGLDQPWYIQYLNYVNGLAHFNLGKSYHYQNKSVNEILASGLPVSLLLGSAALLLSCSLGSRQVFSPRSNKTRFSIAPTCF